MIQFRVRYGQLRAEIDRARRRLAAARALWLALCVPLAALAMRLAGGPSVGAGWVALVGGLVLVGAALGPTARRRGDDARMLDRRFGLDELLVTAVEVDARGPRTALEDRLLDDAAGRLAIIRRGETAEPERLWVEIETAAALALILAGGTILTGSIRIAALPAPRDAAGVSAGAAGSAPGPESAGGRAPGAADRVMAGALRDESMAQSVVAALADGDRRTAVLALRTLADQTRDLSPAGRSNLSEALRDAGAALAPIDPELAAAASLAADGLRRATPPADAQALQSLADALASSAERAPRAGSAALPAGTQASRIRAAATTRGVASGGPGNIGAPPSGGAAVHGERLVDPAAVRGGAAGGSRSAAAAGAGSVPLAEQETVRRYFARTGDGGAVERAR
ncbi:MAG: hypothetical protein IT332_06855 [Ardenticatenales bacterium]|nr:hypothetical protein [Ardenticatenales bacterium]